MPARARRIWRGLTHERAWAVAVLEEDLGAVLDGATLTPHVLAAPQRDRFWADPFPARDAAGALWIFVEELERWRGLGSIAALRVESGVVVEHRIVLRSSHHFSFPQVHRTPAGWIATVETCDPDAHIYTFDAPGEPWRPTGDHLPVGIIDPALATPLDAGRQYLTGSPASDVTGGYRQWVRVKDGSWNPQPEVAFHDDTLGRNAGNTDGARGLRSVQDCAANYGVAASVVAWEPGARGPGAVHRRIEGSDVGFGALGTHTISWTPDGATVVMDVWKRARQPLSAVHRALEQRHGRTCRGRRAAAEE